MKPKIACGCDPGSWVLSTELEAGTSIELKIRGSVRKVFVTIGPVVHHVKSSEYETFGFHYNLPVVEMVGVLEDKWRNLNLVAEF